MIKLETVHIEEVRGIRKLDLNLHKETFVISGPNGSGKSGVIDAIEFGLTGEIGRLTGRGTKGLSVAEHGPHVDKAKFPDAAFVQLKVFLTGIGKSATITRKIASPKKPIIDPADDDVVAVLAQVADHPEIALSRREVLRFILVEPNKRSEEIQTILKLEGLGQLRSALNTAQNRLQSALRTSKEAESGARTNLEQHLQIPVLEPTALLEAVNKRRKVLALPGLAELTADTKLDSGLTDPAKPRDFNKTSALGELQALSKVLPGFSRSADSEVEAIAAAIASLDANPTLLVALHQRSLIEQGLTLVDNAECPLCDTTWDDQERLLKHLREKLQRSEQARTLQETLLRNAGAIADKITRMVARISPVQSVAASQGGKACAEVLAAWKADLDALKTTLSTIGDILGLGARLTRGLLTEPESVSPTLESWKRTLDAKPDQTAAVDAQTFLTVAQLRLGDYREARRRAKAAEVAATTARAVYDTYCRVLEGKLNTLYDEVQKDFCDFYRTINEGDEGSFTAKFTPAEGSLKLDVNFYERGLFPPGAYHSEGHQDGMGVCLYLALMKRLWGERFTLALLDDVVMSVDVGHRYNFCKLLKAKFGDTQFLITTHDRLWAEQMKSARLVTAKTSIAFHGWSIDTGPLVESNQEIWEEIGAALGRGKVEVAAAALRHHLEYVSRLLADLLGATPHFRADGNYELGDLLPSVIERMKKLLSKASEAAQSWNDNATKDAIAADKNALSNCSGVANVEQWAINKAVHYNEWANFGKKDFTPVVAAFRELLERFRCSKCESWMHTTPRVNPETLRCDCNGFSRNLKAKPK